MIRHRDRTGFCLRRDFAQVLGCLQAQMYRTSAPGGFARSLPQIAVATRPEQAPAASY